MTTIYEGAGMNSIVVIDCLHRHIHTKQHLRDANSLIGVYSMTRRHEDKSHSGGSSFDILSNSYFHLRDISQFLDKGLVSLCSE